MRANGEEEEEEDGEFKEEEEGIERRVVFVIRVGVKKVVILRLNAFFFFNYVF